MGMIPMRVAVCMTRWNHQTDWKGAISHVWQRGVHNGAPRADAAGGEEGAVRVELGQLQLRL